MGQALDHAPREIAAASMDTVGQLDLKMPMFTAVKTWVVNWVMEHVSVQLPTFVQVSKCGPPTSNQLLGK